VARSGKCYPAPECKLSLGRALLILRRYFFIQFRFHLGEKGFVVNAFALAERFCSCRDLLSDFCFNLIALLHQPQGFPHDFAGGV